MKKYKIFKTALPINGFQFIEESHLITAHYYECTETGIDFYRRNEKMPNSYQEFCHFSTEYSVIEVFETQP